MLAQAYVTRSEVALVAFRGTTAELILPPTRSLTRARRTLAELPGVLHDDQRNPAFSRCCE